MAITDPVIPPSSAVNEATAGVDTRPMQTFRRVCKQHNMKNLDDDDDDDEGSRTWTSSSAMVVSE